MSGKAMQEALSCLQSQQLVCCPEDGRKKQLARTSEVSTNHCDRKLNLAFLSHLAMAPQ